MNDETAPFCKCGCGNRVNFKRRKYPKFGWNVYYQNGCQSKGKKVGTKDRVVAARGYIFLYMPSHPHANSLYVPEHVVVAEKALGKLLPKGAEVHHVDEDRQNNANRNLVICQDRAYHMLLHQRIDAFKACGNPSWRKCQFCQKYGDPSQMRSYDKRGFTHWDCWRAFMRNYMKEYYKKHREKLYGKVKDRRARCKTQTAK